MFTKMHYLLRVKSFSYSLNQAAASDQTDSRSPFFEKIFQISVKNLSKTLPKKYVKNSAKKSFNKICHKNLSKMTWHVILLPIESMPKMCFFNQFFFFAKNVSTSTKVDYFKADPVLAMTIQSIPCIFRLSAIFFQLSPLAEHCEKQFLYVKLPVTLTATYFEEE